MLFRTIKIIPFILIFLLHSSFLNYDNASQINKPVDPPFTHTDTLWVDSVFQSLTLEERIAQLFMVAAYSNKDKSHVQELEKLIKDYKPGGLVFFQGGPVRQAQLTNHYQSLSKTPLLIGFDAEWGLGMRLDSTIKFPRQMMLGAIEDNDLIYRMGVNIAEQCKRIGIHVNFAPVLDVNNNPDNPVIGGMSRSFGEDKMNVAQKGYMYMLGLQDNNILATGKHFPGHGDTDTDSHYNLPVINQTRARLDTLELFPFKQLIKSGLGGIMIAHLYIPSLDNTKNTASTLSPKVVKELLKDELGFKGVVFTDALNMKGVTDYYKPGMVVLKALQAGCDILVFPLDVPAAIEQIKTAISKKKIKEEEINEKCKKILLLKKWAGLDNIIPVNTDNLFDDLNSIHADLLNRKLVENALTVLKNQDSLLPFKRLDTLKIAALSIGADSITVFQEHLGLYTDIKKFIIKKKKTRSIPYDLIDSLSTYNLIIIGIHNTNNRISQNFNITKKTIEFIDSLSKNKKVVLNIFANPYCLKRFDTGNTEVLLMSYEDTELSQSLSAQLLFGGIPAKGRLPVTASPDFPAGSGIILPEKIRLKYTIPEEAGFDSKILGRIDSITLHAIRKKAFPGCQVLVAKDGAVVYHRSFGYHTYDSIQEVINTDIFDLASITKITATIPSLMKLYEKGSFRIDTTLSYYLPYLNSTNKKDIRINDVMTHQARLKDWIPFYLRTIKTEQSRNYLYNNTFSDKYPVQVADSLFICREYRDTMYQRINSSRLNKKEGYKYSDLGFYYFHEIIERITKVPLNEYADSIFFSPLGAATLCYRPLERFHRSRILPTEHDIYFRKQVVRGYVHDFGAAMLGGVGGHAGVFSNANDLAKMMQMYLRKGEYGGIKYFLPGTIELFSSCPFCPDNRRGLGFDKPEMNKNKLGPTCDDISADSFGHTGFTGTMAWVDPEKNIVYIFLSNRIHPDIKNKMYIALHVRTRIQEVIYKALKEVNDRTIER